MPLSYQDNFNSADTTSLNNQFSSDGQFRWKARGGAIGRYDGATFCYTSITAWSQYIADADLDSADMLVEVDLGDKNNAVFARAQWNDGQSIANGYMLRFDASNWSIYRQWNGVETLFANGPWSGTLSPGTTVGLEVIGPLGDTRLRLFINGNHQSQFPDFIDTSLSHALDQNKAAGIGSLTAGATLDNFTAESFPPAPMDVDDAQHSVSSDSPTFTPGTGFPVDNAQHSVSSESPQLITRPGVVLVGIGGNNVVGVEADRMAAVQVASLAEDNFHTIIDTQPGIAEGFDFDPEDCHHSVQSDEPGLTETLQSIDPEAAFHGVESTSPPLLMGGTVDPDDATHSVLSTSPLVSGQLFSPDSAFHTVESTSPDVVSLLVQPADCTHSVRSDSPTILAGGDVQAHDATHSHLAVGCEVIVNEVSPAAGFHTVQSDSPTIFSGVVLAHDCVHGHGASTANILGGFVEVWLVEASQMNQDGLDSGQMVSVGSGALVT